jgi:hypothetical protein
VLYTQLDRTAFRAAEPDSRYSSFMFDVQLCAEFVCYPYSAASIKLACPNALAESALARFTAIGFRRFSTVFNRFDDITSSPSGRFRQRTRDIPQSPWRVVSD